MDDLTIIYSSYGGRKGKTHIKKPKSMEWDGNNDMLCNGNLLPSRKKYAGGGLCEVTCLTCLGKYNKFTGKI